MNNSFTNGTIKNILYRNNGDGTFTFTLSPAPTADMEYLFVLDGVQEDMVASGTASGNWACTPVTDFANYII